MGVYIKDVEMPKNCWKCPFCLDFEFLDPYECAACMHDFEDGIDIYENSRPDWCPLVEVPDHGDLVDKDEIIIPFLESENDEKWVKVAIDAAPTVIPASKER